MKVKQTVYISSAGHYKNCPDPVKPEYAMIGRSNVGKSSLINMIANQNNLARTSSTPGKTQCINHYEVNKEWYLVDLPGYGFAKVSKTERAKWEKMIFDYLNLRPNLLTVCVLVDIRIEPQTIDIEFMNRLGKIGIPFVIVFTKSDKLSLLKIEAKKQAFAASLAPYWEEIPQMLVTSAVNGMGKDEILTFFEETNALFTTDINNE